jgi:hypothetical protein
MGMGLTKRLRSYLAERCFWTFVSGVRQFPIFVEGLYVIAYGWDYNGW